MTEFCVSEEETPPIYDLYGVANHHGMLIGGHYTSYTRCHCDTSASGNDVGEYGADPPENCHLNVKILPKIVVFFNKIAHWQFC